MTRAAERDLLLPDHLHVELAGTGSGHDGVEDQPAVLGVGVEVLQHEVDEGTEVRSLRDLAVLVEVLALLVETVETGDVSAADVDAHVHGDAATRIADDRAAAGGAVGVSEPRLGGVLVTRTVDEVRDPPRL